jgi:hypothetical protein
MNQHLIDVIPASALAKGIQFEEPIHSFPVPIGYRDGQMQWLCCQALPRVDTLHSGHSFNARRAWNIEQADCQDMVDSDHAARKGAQPPLARRR